MTINHLLDEVETNAERHQRFYLGISGIGNPNQRLLWMRYRWLMPDEWEPRVLRLLDLGNVVEDHLIEKLRKIPGATIYDVRKDGRQFETKAFGGHLKGHIDGVAKNLPGLKPNKPYLLEFKTANDNRFNKLEKLGSYCNWSEEYDAQIHLYMGLFKLDHCIAIVYNKNNSALYTEVIDFDYLKFEMFMEKAENILKTKTPPENHIPLTDYRIRSYMSKKQQAAYLGRSLPEKLHCRSCRFSNPDIKTGEWVCSQDNRVISKEKQITGCANHNYIPELIPAKVLQVDDTFVVYEKDDFRFVNVAKGKQSTGDNFYSSEELIEIVNSNFPKELIAQCENVRKLLNGTISSIRPWVEKGVPF